MGGGESTRPHGLAQVHAVHILHEQVEETTRLAVIVDGYDARVVELGQQSGFPMEPFGEGPTSTCRHRQQLEGDWAVELGLPRPIHSPHAALANQFEDLELREGGRHHVKGRRRATVRGCLVAFGRRGHRGQGALGAKPLLRLGRKGAAALGTHGVRDRSLHTDAFLCIRHGQVTRKRVRREEHNARAGRPT